MKLTVIAAVVLMILSLYSPLFSQDFDFRVIDRMEKTISQQRNPGKINLLHSAVTAEGFFCSFALPPRLSLIKSTNATLEIIPIESKYWEIGPIDGTYLIPVDNKSKLLTYDYRQGRITEPRDISAYPADSPIKQVIHSTYYYQNDIGYVQRRFCTSGESSFPSEIDILNFSTFEEKPFPIVGVIHAISPDKNYLLIDEDEDGEDFNSYKLEDRDFLLYQIKSEQKDIGYGVPFMDGGDPGDIDYGGHFVGNENVLLPNTPRESYYKATPENYWLQHIGDPEHAVKLNLTAKGKQTNLRFSPDFTRALCEVDHIPYLVDATPLRNWLMTHNLLFKETTAKVTDTHIRVRENPNLQAKHMGFLEQGDTVKVLDRSGPKETIDPWGEHPWYRIVRESDGLSGWCFGAFLDLAEEQGELRYEGEGLVTVYEE